MIELTEAEASEVASVGHLRESWESLSPGMRQVAAGMIMELVRCLQLAGWTIERPKRKGRSN